MERKEDLERELNTDPSACCRPKENLLADVQSANSQAAAELRRRRTWLANKKAVKRESSFFRMGANFTLLLGLAE